MKKLHFLGVRALPHFENLQAPLYPQLPILLFQQQKINIKLVMLCTEEASEEFAQIRKRKNEHVFSYYTANFA